MNARDLIHRFANDATTSRKSGNVSCHDGTLFSYAAPIARHTGNPALPMLHTRRTYSVTTSKHCSFARSGTHHIRPAMEVYNPAATYPSEHAENVRDLLDLAAAALRQSAAPRIRPHTRAAHIVEALRHRDNAETYRKAFKLPLDTLDKETRATRATLAKLTPETAAPAADTLARHKAGEDKRREAARKKADEARAKRDREALDEWTRGERGRVYHQGPARLRVRAGRVETSHGATVPAAVALRLWPLAERAHRTGTTYTPETVVMVDVYRLDHVSPQGARIGCHFVPFEEMQRIRPEVEAAAEVEIAAAEVEIAAARAQERTEEAAQEARFEALQNPA